MSYIIFIFSVANFEGINTPVGAPPTYNPTMTSLYVRSPLELSALHASIRSYDEITSPASQANSGYKYLFMIFATIGLVVAGVQASTQGNPKPILSCILINLVIYFCFIRIPAVNSEVDLNCYSEVDTWGAYWSQLGSQQSNANVAVPFGLFLNIVGGITKITSDFADRFGENLTGVSYRAFPYLMGDGINALLEEDYGEADWVDRVDRYVKGCVAPAIEKAYTDNQSLPVFDLEDVVVLSRDIKIVDPTTKEVLDCSSYYNTLKSQMDQDLVDMYQELEAKASGPTQGSVRETIIKQFGAAGFLKGHPQPELADVTDVVSGITMSKLMGNVLSKFTQSAEHTSGGSRSKAYRFFSKIFGSFAEWGTSFFGGLAGDVAWRAFPYISAFAITLFFLGLPIVILFSLIPGGRMILLNYLRGLVWVFSWLPFTVAANGLINSFTRINTVNHLMAGMTQGVVDLGTLQRLSVTSSIAQGLGSLFVIIIPFLSYAIIARGSFGGMAQGISTVTGAMVASGAQVTNAAVGTASTTLSSLAKKKGK
ncbi:MAG: conjugal transfer protein TraG N-terminal domain-containing protein [Candidatus Zambryskibacteria bacterium]|nr:conjugal transfer protein TraG N-terminal domain-containing protein [Candidatus Zambryskibacteria bacterium]